VRANRPEGERAPAYKSLMYCLAADLRVLGWTTADIAEVLNRDESAIDVLFAERFEMNRIGSTNKHDRHDVLTYVRRHKDKRLTDIDRPVPKTKVWGGRSTINEMRNNGMKDEEIADMLNYRVETVEACRP
jgi:hypothetical protein